MAKIAILGFGTVWTASSKVEKDTTVTITDGMAAGVFGSGI